MASGEYIEFLDSDDWIHKDLYETLYYLAKEYSSDITVCNFKRVYNEEEKLNFCSDKIDIYSNIEALEQVYKDKYLQMIVAWNKLYKKKLFDNLRYPVGKIHEDEFLTPLLLHKANKIIYVNKELIYYRQRNGSIMNSKFTTKRLDYLDDLLNRLDYYKSNNMKIFYKYDLQNFINIILNIIIK